MYMPPPKLATTSPADVDLVHFTNSGFYDWLAQFDLNALLVNSEIPTKVSPIIDWHKTKKFIAISRGKNVYIYSQTRKLFLEPAICLDSLTAKGGEVRSLAWCFESASLLIGTQCGVLYCRLSPISLNSDEVEIESTIFYGSPGGGILQKFTPPVDFIQPSPQGRLFLTGSTAGDLTHLWDATAGGAVSIHTTSAGMISRTVAGALCVVSALGAISKPSAEKIASGIGYAVLSSLEWSTLGNYVLAAARYEAALNTVFES